MADDNKIIPMGNDTFECVLRFDERPPADFHEWPESYRKGSDAAIARLLADNPGASVTSDTSEVIDETDPRFPDGDDHRGKFFGIRTVKLDRPGKTTAAAPVSAVQRLRAFEDKVLGEDITRINGELERGLGSKYQRMTDDDRAKHSAFEVLVKAEARLAQAAADLESAEAEHGAALSAVEQAESHVDAAAE